MSKSPRTFRNPRPAGFVIRVLEKFASITFRNRFRLRVTTLVLLVFVCGLSGCGFLSPPPEKVPEGKTAQEYYDLGVQYKAVGWTEQARDALTRAILLGKGDDIAIRAKRYLETKVPRYPAAEEAVHMNIEGFNLNLSNRDGAEKVWLECIKKYPKFEWAYSNLGQLYVDEGKYQQGEELLNKALEINPSYVNAWLHLAESKHKQKDFADAHKYIKKALELDPDDTAAQLMNKQPDS